ncbi:hypothetical protein [Aliidiomarina maris]|uniref:Lipoprotein n=1 Tax=Aliidiomarina maris TaxID=531312 RepID=A0A327WPF1_9GAMM|nr:hypothetical protein [Aliidiomarina maris]RAJ93614.1 hypothetical protein B0I24_11720 [Aliidiomarina maris]RUO19068.1 hypothetical protein CWE07_13225 [Aliidiomarina maris]
MKKTRLSLALAAIFSLSLGLAACSDPDDQRGDPMDPAQETSAAEREARQQEVRDERNPTAETDDDDLWDAARDPSNQPAPAMGEYRNKEYREDLMAGDISELGDASDPQTVRTHEQEHAELQQTLREYLQRTRADNENQCAMLPYGHKPCGGPETYMVYSQKDMSDSDIEQLEQRVARYNQLDAFIKTTRGVMSNCQVTPEPEIRFENGRCVASQGRL